jgi:phospholipid/cholesterol/gamma-HCH transport system permease protein
METDAISQISYQEEGDTLVVDLSGRWTLHEPAPPVTDILARFKKMPNLKRLGFNASQLAGWESTLITYIRGVIRLCKAHHIQVDAGGLPEGVQRLIALADAVPPKKDARSSENQESFLTAVGGEFLDFVTAGGELMGFIGEALVATLRMARGRAQFRVHDAWLFLQDAGAHALPIVSLISLLVGLILAFIGLVQLEIFGAEVFVADLVGIGMVREMGAVMTGVIMAGRTGAAYAAQLGTMQVNEEIDALQTLGISPMEFLVIPRMMALTLMMPVLCLYANLMGIIGGLIVAAGIYDISMSTYVQRVVAAVGVNDLAVGLVMSFVFGILVALAGCLRGIQCGRSASAVGDAATSAVVTGIVAIVIATAVITVVCNVIGV